MLGKTTFKNYYYIINIRLDPLNITEDLIYFSLKYVTIFVQSHWDPIIPEFINRSNNSCKVATLGKKSMV